MVPHENVLNGEHGSMPHMEGTCDVWRWEHNRERLRIRCSNTFCNTGIGTKKRRGFPLLISRIFVLQVIIRRRKNLRHASLQLSFIHIRTAYWRSVNCQKTGSRQDDKSYKHLFRLTSWLNPS